MPKVPPTATPSGRVIPMVDPVFMAMASFEFVADAKAQTPPTPKEATADEPPTVRD